MIEPMDFLVNGGSLYFVLEGFSRAVDIRHLSKVCCLQTHFG